MNLDHMLEFDELIKRKEKIKKVFFYRICGTGMGACACLLKEVGFEVEGADISFSPPMSTYLESINIPLYDLNDITAEKLSEYDLVIVGNSVPRNSEYAKIVEESGVSFTSFPTILGAYVLKDKNVIGIAGTHGKTTTTFFLTQLLEKLKSNPGYFIGGIIDGRPPSKLGKDSYFIIESDEYDSAYFQKYSKFRQYEIDHLILTSLEFDHADIFDTIEDIKDEFRATLDEKKVKQIIFDDSYSAATELQTEYATYPWQHYSLNSISFNSETSMGTEFSFSYKDEKLSFKTNVIGKQNILNIVSGLIFLLSEGYIYEDIKVAVAELSMVKRRQEERGVYKKTIVIDDFAHHPRSVELTIDSIKTKYDHKKITVIFEPVSATARSSIFQSEFAQSLTFADKVILANPNVKTTAYSGENLDFNKIVDFLTEKSIPAVTCENISELRSTIDNYIEGDDVLLILSNRTCLGLWESDFINELK
ncbi:MAG: UDP-N-acetylmuramate: L-alanyl-gamma-D-glutamyl-meso-diaminopimelate ligase [Thermoproteota archaeon]|jgi:UDP-N-acetylmuramate: L-alanyl-gamma-D-glutamyl-meso-diaminopimelate ligase